MTRIPAVSAPRTMGPLKPMLAGLAIAGTALLAPSAVAAAGNADAGREVARKTCASCHRLPDGTGGGRAPPLRAYREQQPFTATGLRKLVGSWPHAGAVSLPPDRAYPDLAAFLNGIDKAAAPERSATDRRTPQINRSGERRGDTPRLGGYEDEHEEHEAYEDEHGEMYEDEHGEAYEDD